MLCAHCHSTHRYHTYRTICGGGGHGDGAGSGAGGVGGAGAGDGMEKATTVSHPPGHMMYIKPCSVFNYMCFHVRFG